MGIRDEWERPFIHNDDDLHFLALQRMDLTTNSKQNKQQNEPSERNKK